MLDFIEDKDDVRSGDNWSYKMSKAHVISSLVLGTGTRVPESIPGPGYPFHYPGTRVKITTRTLLNEILFSVLFLLNSAVP